MGALLPLVCTVYETLRHARRTEDRTRSPAAGRTVGAVYAANTVGTIFGASVAGFVLIPLPGVGMQRTIMLASGLSVLIGTVFVIHERAWRRTPVYAATVIVWLVAATFASLSAPWSKALMVSGPYLRGAAASPARDKVLFYREGIDTTVAVLAAPDGNRTLVVNGKPEASSLASDMRTQLLLAHIPLLLRPDAQDVCVIGLGSGVTAGAVLAHPVERVDAVEISAAVITAAQYFNDCNNNVFGDPRVHLHRADGRNFLLLEDRRYDVITSEPSNPWISGIANLFSAEFLELAHRRLRPGGLHCQWIHGYDTKADDVAAVVKTMSEVFAHVQLWDASFADYLIIGSDAPLELDLERMYLTFNRPAVNQMLGFLFINDPLQLGYHYIANRRHLSSWADRQRPLTDDLPRLEFSAPRYLLGGEPGLIAQALYAIEGTPSFVGDPDSLLNREFTANVVGGRQAKLLTAASRSERDLEDRLHALLRMIRCAPDDWRVFEYVRMLVDAGHPATPSLQARIDQFYTSISAAAPWIGQLRERGVVERAALPWPIGEHVASINDPRFEGLMAEAEALAERGDPAAAFQTAKKALQAFPDSLRALRAAGAWGLEAAGPEVAIPYLLKAWIRARSDPETAFSLAGAYALKGDAQRALAFLEIAADNGFRDRARLKSGGMFEFLARNPRFRQLLDRLNRPAD
jgi:spermidine synthase